MSRPASSAAAAAADSGLVSPLLLLDALKINLHLEHHQGSTSMSASGASGLHGRASPGDSDEESDAGYDPSAPEPSQPGRRAVSGGLGIGLSSDSDTDDEEDEQLQQLHKMTLHAAAELPGRFWACHDQGCWGMNVKWLQQLNGGNGMERAGSNSSGGGWGEQQQQQQSQLPAPALQELLVSGSGVCSSCVVGNALFGSGCVVLEKGLGPHLLFLKPRPTGVLGEGVVAAEGADAAAAAEDEGGALGVAELLLTPEELDTKSRQQVGLPSTAEAQHKRNVEGRNTRVKSQLGVAEPLSARGFVDV